MAFQHGLSGLNASSRNLDVIGHNIANANTVGMKTSRAEFSELYASSINASGGINSGIGVTVATVSQMFTQGNITVTGNDMDVAINGNGFFEVTMPDGSMAYSRAGMFKLDNVGNIITNEGANLMGYPTDAAGVRTAFESQPLKLPTGGPIPAKLTTAITAEFNLDARAPIAAAVVPPTPFGTYSTSLNGFDAQGLEVPVTFVFEKVGNNQWNVYPGVNGADPAASVPFAVNFLADGTLDPATVIPQLQLASPNDPAEVFNVDISFDDITQFGADFAVSNLSQDGYRPGELTSLGIGDNGVITARYSNGQSQAAGQIALVNFRNAQGLSPTGGGNWVATAASGEPIAGAPGEGKFGSLKSGALEDSNVDLTGELVNMMTAQRAYQANAQTIKTQDQIMSTLLNMR
ncbi:flagellar hook protein FlgE [Hydrogenophaga sp. PAMC20947]|uniref:flagellar hook protein FlgE n=1 Tax=Hydrogenophaga sp. PAMC20947 TaxID=2565558 RepID=UPI00109DCB98|nr:flagellar hook protein FlgE [Hydrogenophaga sp. PAMC20947]QCB46795.1 flagellar hook protein FlgE [Hydrogenophaga sp. PAMC20947]